MIRQHIQNILLLIKYFFKITNTLKSKDIFKIQLFNFQNWHHGYAYFIGEYKGKKVFVKVDTKLHFLQNDILFYSMCQQSLKDYLVPIVDYIINDHVQIVIYEFLEGQELSEKLILETPDILEQIFDILVNISKLRIVHRDIKLDNFFVIDNKIKIIDFTFANSTKDNNTFKELDLSVKVNCEMLEFLGIGLNPKIFEWNDFYSMKTILKRIVQEQNKQIEGSTKNMLENYIDKLEEFEIGNTYKIKCNSKCYFWMRQFKKTIKDFLGIKHQYRSIKHAIK